MGTRKKPLLSRQRTAPVVLAFDPGITTGWAKLDLENDAIDVGTFDAENVDVYAATLRIIKQFKPDQIIIERMPREMDQRTGAVVALCEKAIIDYGQPYSRIAPSEWKPLDDKHKLPYAMRTQHEKDAYRMSMYYLYKCQFIRRPVDEY